MQTPSIYTIGHSNHGAQDLLEWLQACSITCLVDVRRHPGSRRLPQFNQGNLRRMLSAGNIDYRWYGESLGGQRDPGPEDAAFTALPEGPLRGFAAHMNTPAFRSAIGECLQLAASRHTALMCAERDPARCHRRLISDYLCLSGHQVQHIIGIGSIARHEPDSSARLDAGKIYYDRGTQPELGF